MHSLRAGFTKFILNIDYNKPRVKLILRWVSISRAMLHSVVRCCLSMCGAIGGNGNLRCIAQLCARTNMIRLLLVLQKKIVVCAHLVGTGID